MTEAHTCSFTCCIFMMISCRILSYNCSFILVNLHYESRHHYQICRSKIESTFLHYWVLIKILAWGPFKTNKQPNNKCIHEAWGKVLKWILWFIKRGMFNFKCLVVVPLLFQNSTSVIKNLTGFEVFLSKKTKFQRNEVIGPKSN